MPSTNLRRIEAPTDPLIGGFVISYPSGTQKVVTWRSEAPIVDSLAAAKQYAATLLQGCLEDRRTDDAERTNWPSVAAAVQRIVRDWSELRRAALYAAPAGCQAYAAPAPVHNSVTPTR